jgi:hypothetical protein
MYPGEPVAEDEMRVTVFGSGYGYVRAGQADQSIYVEVGNGDTFMFDMGEGAEANYMTMQVPYSKITNLFVTHLRRQAMPATTVSHRRWRLAPIHESEDQTEDECEDHAPDDRDIPAEEELQNRED